MNPIFTAYQQADLFGKSIFISLFFLSVITWVIFLQKWLFQRMIRRSALALKQAFQKKIAQPLNLECSTDHPFSTIYRGFKKQTVEVLTKNQSSYLSRSDIELIDNSLDSVIATQAKGLEKNLFILSTITSLAPFLGLLGTVWGILLTFSELQAGGAAHANATIMGGLSMALGTTVLGLIVAIPALIGYNTLRAQIADFTTEMDDFSHELVRCVELQYRKVEV